MTESQMIEENYGLAFAAAKRFCKSGAPYDFDDLLQVALMSMVRVHRKYIPEKGRFSTFATFCMRHDLIKFVTKQNKIKDRDTPLILESYEQPEEIDYFLPDNLTIQEQAIFYYKKNNYNNKEICEILDITRETFKELENSCYQKVKNANT